MIINWTAICAWVSHCSQINKENSIITFYRLLYLSLPEVIHSKRDKHLLTTLKKKIKKKIYFIYFNSSLCNTIKVKNSILEYNTLMACLEV